jgi:uncharacterized protein (DUF2252 family)
MATKGLSTRRFHLARVSAAEKNRSKLLDAPSWLWRSTVDLLVSHERAYLDHCRKYALDNP